MYFCCHYYKSPSGSSADSQCSSRTAIGKAIDTTAKPTGCFRFRRPDRFEADQLQLMAKTRFLSALQSVLVDHAAFHNHVEDLVIILQDGDIFQRVAVDQEDIGMRSYFNDTDLARIGAAFTR